MRGLHDGVPIALGYFAVSFTFGMMAVSGFTGNGLHSVAGTAKAGNVDFDDFRFHGKPPDQIDNYKCPFMIVHVFASAGNEKVAGKFLFTFPG